MDNERLRPWRRIGSRSIVDTKFLRLRADTVELPNGAIVDDYYVRESNGFCVVFALTAERNVVLVRQYKYGGGVVVTELPAGMIDPGEAPEACARRELREETGYTADRFELVRTFLTDPTSSNGRYHLYLAHDARPTHGLALDPTEEIETEVVSLAAFRALLRDGTIWTGSQVAACWTALDHLGELA